MSSSRRSERAAARSQSAVASAPSSRAASRKKPQARKERVRVRGTPTDTPPPGEAEASSSRDSAIGSQSIDASAALLASSALARAAKAEALVNELTLRLAAQSSPTGTPGTTARASPVVPQPVPPPSSSPRASAQGATPRGILTTTFGGDGKQLDQWITQMNVQLNFFDGLTDSRAVDWLATGLNGAAGSWYGDIIRTGNALPSSPKDLFDKLRKHFQPVNTAQVAREQLEALVQGRDSVNAYAVRHNEIVAYLPTLDADSRLRWFVKGLNIELQKDLARIEPQPTTITETIAAAVRIEAANNRFAGKSHSVSAMDDDYGRMFTQAQVNAIAEQAAHRALAGAASSGPSRSPYDTRRDRGANPRSTPIWQEAGLSQEEGNRRRAANVCMWCTKPDHRMNGCPDKKAGKPARLN